VPPRRRLTPTGSRSILGIGDTAGGEGPGAQIEGYRRRVRIIGSADLRF
jgi:hypothetical protein